MAKIVWDAVGEHFYETGVDHGVLYLLNTSNNTYDSGYAWNGLTAVNENPSGADATKLWADNIKYLNLIAAEEFGATIEAYTYPDEFAQCDGSVSVAPGVTIGQQSRKTFGLCYRTKIGNDVAGSDLGYKLHLIYGCTASPSSRSYTTINDSPDAIQFSWEINTVAVPVTEDYKPTACIVIDSTKADPDKLEDLLDILYGTDGEGQVEGTTPMLPMPDEIIGYLD